MNSIKNFLPLEVRKMLYFSLFQCHLSYGILLWGPSMSAYHFDKINKQQKKAVRIVKNVPYNSHTDPIFNELNLYLN